MADIKKRRISTKDWKKVGEKIRDDLSSRKNQAFRTQHEAIWKEVDRQIIMRPMTRIKKGESKDKDWRSALELGELSKASEIITADVMRLTFPSTRAWFEAHSEIPAELDQNTGLKQDDPKFQNFADRAIRAFMVQQHLDFGLKARYELSVKEALHHGSYVAEIRFEDRQKFYDGTGVENFSSPVWQPYSMWNAYPDPSPSVIGTDNFYTGSMILVDFLPMYRLKEMANGEGWMTSQLEKVTKRTNNNKDVKTEDIEIIKYKGDIEMDREDGAIYLPNSEIWLANDVPVYYSTGVLPFPNIIFSGYERLDVRDPYYTSPLIKMSPEQKLASALANKLVDNIWLKVEPPIVYDGNDPQFVLNGGPEIAPGAKVPTKGQASFKEIQIGDPQTALAGLEMMIRNLNTGLGINAVRSGAGNDVSDKTATEIETAEARAEIRTAEFVDKQERHALRPFLYMQHELNKKLLTSYAFYNPELDSPDFMRIRKEQLPKNVQFEIVGSRGVLGERTRRRGLAETTAFLLSNPITAKIPKAQEISKQLYQDAGVRNPEIYLNTEDDVNIEAQQIQEEAQKAINELQGQIFELEKKLAITKAVNEAKASVEVAKTAAEPPTVNVVDSSAQGSLDGLSSAIASALNKMEQSSEMMARAVDMMSRPKSIDLVRDRAGRAVGAISKIEGT